MRSIYKLLVQVAIGSLEKLVLLFELLVWIKDVISTRTQTRLFPLSSKAQWIAIKKKPG